ncbi:hypothetical protein H0H87_000272, partial [Tephrocybe sp. NHM501043]
FLYSLFIAINANFHLKHQNVSSNEVDPGLSKGWSYFMHEINFKGFLGKFDKLIVQESECYVNTDFCFFILLQGQEHMHFTSIKDQDMVTEANKCQDLHKQFENDMMTPPLQPSGEDSTVEPQELALQMINCWKMQLAAWEDDHSLPNLFEKQHKEISQDAV